MKPIISRITLEVLGSPKEHVEKTLQDVLAKLHEEKEVKILSKKVYESKEMDNKLWSTFSDIEFQVESMKKVFEVCYDYMPSTIEILEPAGMEIDCNDMEILFNDVLTRLHKYSMVLKKLQSENIYMMKELQRIKNKVTKVTSFNDPDLPK